MSNEEDLGELAPLVDEADLILPSDDSISGLGPNEARGDGDESVPSDTIGILSALRAFKPALPRDGISLPTRPGLRREGSVPAPRQPPPDPPPVAPDVPDSLRGGDPGLAPDSLSLQQLRALVRELPRQEPAPYAFVYQDAASLPEELEEWFSYDFREKARIAKTHSSFAHEWGDFNGLSFAEGSGFGSEVHDWANAPNGRRKEFVEAQLDGLSGTDLDKRLYHLETLVYLALGCWHESAGLQSDNWRDTSSGKSKGKRGSSGSTSLASDVLDKSEELNSLLESQYDDFGLQLEWIKRNTEMILSCKGPQPMLDIFKATIERECHGDATRLDISAIQREAEQRETWCAATLLYLCLEVIRTLPDEKQRLAFRSDLLDAKPNLLIYLNHIINNIRWDDTIQIPLVKILLLDWKAVLVMLGGLPEVTEVKDSFQEKDPTRDKPTKPTITASPLDYHSFRQEITSKYPSYIPPTGTFPLEPDQKSILPPLRANTSRTTSGVFQAPSQHGSSILHQPVHIATPAPSPPPSPAAGKGGKKQNYQTNQLFPFLYPPLDVNSNELGGKGTTYIQDSLVGRRWEGADIPISILEASELFSSRIRATRALKQLWDARNEFLRYERGWIDSENKDVAPLSLDDNIKMSLEDIKTSLEKDAKAESQTKAVNKLIKPRIHDGSIEDRMDTVEEFYRDGLPHLQSVVVVVLKTILATLTSLIANASLNNANQSAYENGNGTTQANGNDAPMQQPFDTSSMSDDELEALRTQEITAKAASGVMLLMLKWFKVSHILKFEYLCQLLVDANYVPIILKLLQSQEIERIVNCKSDRISLNLFHYCRSISRNAPAAISLNLNPTHIEDSSEDEALPPPIRRHRAPTPPPPMEAVAAPIAPEVDELGLPTAPLPPAPITTFSWRNFFSSINFLRILQKSCKSKAHRNLMLVQYKSAAYLRKALRVPQRELRLYTLKLFKNQVPYCGRKWRQSNMRVITAVYLHCRPELRDDWLLSADVDSDVDMAVPMEQSLRALTYYYNLKNYATQMGAVSDGQLAEQDFFARELEKLEWEGIGADIGDQESVDQGWEGMEHM